MLLKPCGKCKKLIPYGLRYCDVCAPIAEAERAAYIQASRAKSNRKYNKQRDPKYSQFYNSKEWRTLSAKRLMDDGFRCLWCGKIADEVDHIAELKTPEGWERRLDYSNLRSLCHTCHNKRHGRFAKKQKRF